MKLGGSKSLYDFLFVYVAYTLRYVYLLILIPYYGRVLGADGYGIVLSAMSIMNLAWIITGWGFSAAGVRAIAVAKESEYGQLFAQHFSARVLLSLVAVSVVMIIRVVGLILVIALLTIPPYLAGRFARSLGRMMLAATLLSMLFCAAGLWVSFRWNITSGASIIACATLAFFAVLGGEGVYGMLRGKMPKVR